MTLSRARAADADLSAPSAPPVRAHFISADHAFAEQLRQLLNGWFEINLRNDSLQKLAIVAENAPEVVLFDMSSATAQAEAWLKTLCHSERAFPIVTLSMECSAAIRARALSAGADDHLMAPFSRESLLTRLDPLLAIARFRRQQARMARLAQDSEERLQFTLAATQVGQWEVDLNSGTIQQSPRYDQIFGYVPGAKTWTYQSFLAHIHAEDRDEVALAVLDGREFECRMLRLDQAARWLWGKGAKLRSDDGTRQRRSGLIMDITQRKEAELQLRDADRRKDEFLATLAHELRNPLAPLRNGLQIMKLASDDPAAMVAAREMMERQLEHMVRLVNDLLDMSRISRGKLSLQKQRIDIATVINSALEASRPLINLAGHDLIVTLPEQALYVDGDITRLSQVVSNLLDNAAKYTRSGGRIRLSVEARKRQILLSVSDNGAGIAKPVLSKVFDAFAHLTPSLERTQGGLGIGLSIVKRLVEMHGGSVEVRSEGRGTGSEFLVRLPRAEIAAQPVMLTLPDKTEAVPPPRRILVVDDNVDSALSLAAILELEGNEMCTVHDGPAALDAAAAFHPEVIFLDIGLPELNGYEVCRRIRQQSWGGDIVIVALTGWGQQQDLERTQAAGFDRHLIKPVEIGVIEDVLNNVAVGTARRH